MPIIVQTQFRPANVVKNIHYTGLGSAQWSSPSNAAGSPDSTYATCAISNSTDPSYYLKADDFHFDLFGIPDDAHISGIYVRITRKASNTFNIKDDHVRLFTGSPTNFTGLATYGNDLLYPGSTTYWDTSDGTSIYGGTGDFLGLPSGGLLGIDIRQSGFGFAFACSGSATPQTASVDSLEMSLLWVSGLTENSLTLFLMADTLQSGQTQLFTLGHDTATNLDRSIGSFAPNQVNGLVGWWGANISNSVFQDPTTSGNSADNQPAGLWLNQVSNNHLRQYTFTKKPTYIDNGTGFLGRPYIAFDGTDDSLGLNSGIVLNGNFSIWLLNSLLDGDNNVNNTILSASGNLLTTISQSGLQLSLRSDAASGIAIHNSIGNGFDLRYIERNNNTITYKPYGVTGPSYFIYDVSGNMTLNTLGERLNVNFYKGNIDSLLIYNQTNSYSEQTSISEYLGIPTLFSLYTYGTLEASNGLELSINGAVSNNALDLFTQGSITITNLDGSSDTFSPAQVDGLVGWWDANISNTVFQDPLTSGNSIHNQPAGLWLNQIGNNHLRQYTLAKKPTYINDGTGFLGRPYVTFDGTDDSLGLASDIALSGEFSIWLINSLLDGDANVNNTILSTTGNLLTTISQSGLQLFTRSNIASGYISHGSISNGFDIRYIERNGNTIIYRPNGLSGPSYSVPNISGTLTLNTLGERLNTNFYKGGIEALLIYNERNNDSEQTSIGRYLGFPTLFGLYTYGSFSSSSGVDLYLQNTIASGSPLDLFTIGPMEYSESMNLFLRTIDPSYISTSGRRQFSPTLYLKGSPLGTGIQDGNLFLFLESSRVQAPFNLFVKVDNSAILNSYMNLFVHGRRYEFSKALSLYVGASGEIKNLNLYTKGRGFVETDNPFYPADGFYPYSGGMNLFIMRDPSEMLNLFLQCQISSGNLPLYVNGAFLINSGINLVMPSTRDSGIARQLLFTRGGV